MQRTISPLDAAVIAAYLLGVIAIGLWVGRRDRSLSAYLVAGRNLPWWALLGSIVATETSTATFLSVPGIAYAPGGDLRFLQLAAGFVLGRILVAVLLLPGYLRGEFLSAYQLLRVRFGSRVQQTSSLIFLVARNLGDGLRLYLAALALERAIGLSLAACVLLLGIVTIVYTLAGGLRSVVWNDCVQLVIYLAGGVAAFAVLVSGLPAGWQTLADFAREHGKFRLIDASWNPGSDMNLWAGLIGGTFLSLGTHGTDQMMVQRYLSARSGRDAAAALIASGLAVFLQFALFLLIGIGLACYFEGHATLAGDEVFASFIVNCLPPGLVGLLLAAVFAAAMSTLSSSLNSSAAVAVADFGRDEAETGGSAALLRCRIWTVVFGLLQMGLAVVASYYSASVVRDALAIAGFSSGILLGVFLTGRLAGRVGESAMLLGMLAGSAAVVGLWLDGRVAWPWYTVAGAVTTFLAAWVASRCHVAIRALVITALAVSAMGTTAPAAEDLAARGLPVAAPEDVGLDTRRLDAIAAIVEEGIRRGELPGAVVLIARRGAVVYHRAFGDRQAQPERVAMTCDTVFDLASLTKPIATATSVMKLVEQGRVRLDDPIAAHLPGFEQQGKQGVTIRHLLTHQGGLVADNSLADYEQGPEEALARLLALKPIADPGARFVYSDVGFIALAELVRKVAGKSIAEFSREVIFQPLGMADTTYCPPSKIASRCAPTEQRESRWMRGEVHDPRAHLLGGVAGHAGLFSTSSDLAIYGQMLLQEGEYLGVRVLAAETVREMIRPGQVAGGGWRALGWDVRSGYSSNRGDLFSPRAFGHGGFTGTGLWIDPEQQLVVVFLSNRLHPDGNGSVNPLIGRIGTVATAAILPDDGRPARGPVPPRPAASLEETRLPEQASDPADEQRRGAGPTGERGTLSELPHTALKQGETAQPELAAIAEVLAGVDVLERDEGRLLRGRRVGLITNVTGATRRGESTARLLSRMEGVQLVALFSPEHGIAAKRDEPRIGDERDTETGLPVFSLYGDSRRPTAEQLQLVDTLVFDIQDVGARFYTYISTLLYAMQAAAEQRVRFVVLDRPNPINGVDVEGPVLDDGQQSFVGCHTLPVRHGMTAGELARMFREELRIEVELEVVAVEGWRRCDYFDRTGLLWINPSPNMRSLTQAVLYPGVGLLEMTNLSVGRGTDTPFEVLGAPWLDGRGLAAEMNAAELPGVRFVPLRFTPASSRYAGELCGGVNLVITERAVFRPLRTGLAIARCLAARYPDTWEAARVGRLLADETALQRLLGGAPLAEIEASWAGELDHFLQRRNRYLIYR